MFHKIKIRFIVLFMSTVFVLLSAIIVCMNVINYQSIVREVDMILSIMAENEGTFPKVNGKDLPPFMSQEAPHESRYFSVVLNENKEIVYSDFSKISAVNNQKAYEYSIDIMDGNRKQGFVDKYRYLEQEENGLHRITFLDCGVRLYSFQSFLRISLLIGLAGYVVFFIVILFYSDKIMKPVSESYKKQRCFITDAGHELKTPLSIINADVYVLEMELGEKNEWLDDIRKQAERLAGLTNDLTCLSRMEEEVKDMPMIEFSFSDVVTETVSSYYSLAKMQNKNLQCSIPPLMSLTGNEKEIRQLVNILMDNALKYSPDNGLIAVDAKKQGRHMLLTFFNTTQVPIPKEKLDMIFERFYRLDSSRSSMTGGYGIGLSIAKAIVNAHNGKIYATTTGEYSIKIVILLPL